MRTQAQRILCLWLPAWGLQRLIVSQPELDQHVLLLTELRKQGEFVRHCNPLARKRGVRAGMPVAEARTFLRPYDRLTVQPVRPVHERQALVELALRCERFSFCIGLEDADDPESILMNVTGIAHLFGGEEALAAQLGEVLESRRYQHRIAIAETIGSAWAAAHWLAGPHQPVVLSAGELDQLESLPTSALRLDDALVTRLLRLGIRTIRQLLDLDRDSLARRFGRHLLVQIDQFLGRRVESIVPCHPQPVYRVQRTLDEGVSHPHAIDQLWSQLLSELLNLLAPRHLGTRHLTGRYVLENRTSQLFHLRLSHATNDRQHIHDLLRLKLETLRLRSPIIRLQMEALEVAPLESVQREMFDDRTHIAARRFSMLLNRLASRLGEEAVLVPALLASPVPERSVRWSPVTDHSPLECNVHSDRFHGLDRPTALFPEPRPIEVLCVPPETCPVVVFWKETRFDVARASDPERIESDWWTNGYVRRDYYWIETANGRWLWIFQRLQDRRWFWHGELF